MSDLDDYLKTAEKQDKGAKETKSASILKAEMAEADAKTRRKLALHFIWWYFALLFIIIVGVPIYNAFVHEMTAPNNDPLTLGLIDILQVYSSIVGPLAGFVIAYYFKSNSD